MRREIRRQVLGMFKDMDSSQFWKTFRKSCLDDNEEIPDIYLDSNIPKKFLFDFTSSFQNS